MRWENYTINETTIPVIELLKDDALNALKRAYGKYYVEPDIYDDLLNDVFTYFPILMQQLAISRLLDAYAVNTHDLDTETTTRTEKVNESTNQNSTLTAGTSVIEANSQDNTQKTTGTVKDESTQTGSQDSVIDITNSSNTELTGSHTVSMTHNMPEQSIDGTTKEFVIGDDGTPELKTSTIQNASETYGSNSPINSGESSNQQSSVDTTTTTDNTTTNDVTVTDEMTGNRTLTNSGSDNSNSNTQVTADNITTESRELQATNKQYAYEVAAFLDVAGKTVAFEIWTNRFSWVVGIQ